MTQSNSARAAKQSGVAATPAVKRPRVTKKVDATVVDAVVDAGVDEPSPRELRRRQRIEVGREQVLDAAENLFGFNGYNATSLEQVAKACEFSVGALYMFFNSKQELLEAVLDRRGMVVMEAMRSCLAEDVSGDRMLAEVVSTIIDFHRRYPGFGRLSMRVYSPALDVLPPAAGKLATFNEAMDIYATAIERGQRDGTIRNGDPQQLARLVSGLVTAHHSVDARLTGAPQGMEVDELLEIIAGAMSVPRRGRARTAAR
jgi:AcrR family transcriptional regulator